MASGLANNPKAATSAARHARTERGGVRTAKAHAGACTEGADRDEVAASAARRAYAARSIANNPKAVTSAARRGRTARAAVRMVEANAGACNEGSDGDKAAASTAWRVYMASGLANDPKAATSAARCAHGKRGRAHGRGPR